MPGTPPSWTPDQEEDFLRDLQFHPAWSRWRNDFIDGFGGEPNTSPGGDYDYRRAWMYGANPSMDRESGTYHGQSSVNAPPYREPYNLKADDHSTMWKEHFMRKFGAHPQDANPNDPEQRNFILDVLRRKFGN